MFMMNLNLSVNLLEGSPCPCYFLPLRSSKWFSFATSIKNKPLHSSNTSSSTRSFDAPSQTLSKYSSKCSLPSTEFTYSSTRFISALEQPSDKYFSNKNSVILSVIIGGYNFQTTRKFKAVQYDKQYFLGTVLSTSKKYFHPIQSTSNQHLIISDLTVH